MTGDRFGEPTEHPVCRDCIIAWYETGIVDRDELRAYRIASTTADNPTANTGEGGPG